MYMKEASFDEVEKCVAVKKTTAAVATAVATLSLSIAINIFLSHFLEAKWREYKRLLGWSVFHRHEMVVWASRVSR